MGRKRIFLISAVSSAVVAVAGVALYRIMAADSSGKSAKKIEQSGGGMAHRKETKRSTSKQNKVSKETVDQERGKVSWLPGLRVREQKILDVMPINKPVTMMEVAKHFPDVTVRTLRRDMERLMSKGRVKKSGTTRATSYIRI